jgi:hypothetical protein
MKWLRAQLRWILRADKSLRITSAKFYVRLEATGMDS